MKREALQKVTLMENTPPSHTHTHTRARTQSWWAGCRMLAVDPLGSVLRADGRAIALSHADTEHVFTCLCLDSRCRSIFYLRSRAAFDTLSKCFALSLCLSPSLCPAIFFCLTFILEPRVIFYFFCIIL